MKKIIKIKGMTCRHCEGRVKKELQAICGVKSVEVSAADNRVIVELAHKVDVAKLKTAIEEAGYRVVSVE